MPQLDPAHFASQLFWLAVAFVLLLVLMRTALAPRIAEVLEARQRRIGADLDRAAAVKAEAEQVMADYQLSLAKAKAEAQSVLAEAAKRMAADAARRQAETAARLNEQVKAGEARIAQAKDDALANVRVVAGEAAVATVKRLIGTEPPADRVKDAVAAAAKERA